MSKFVMPDGREYPIALKAITNKEAGLLQEVTGKKYFDLVEDLDRAGPDGKAAFLWLAMRKADHHVNYGELDFPMATTMFYVDELDPTKGPAATKAVRSSSKPSTRSTRSSGRRTTPK